MEERSEAHLADKLLQGIEYQRRNARRLDDEAPQGLTKDAIVNGCIGFCAGVLAVIVLAVISLLLFPPKAAAAGAVCSDIKVPARPACATGPDGKCVRA